MTTNSIPTNDSDREAGIPVYHADDQAEIAYQQWRVLNIMADQFEGDASLTEDQWREVEQAQMAVMNCSDATPRAAERKLWISLMHTLDDAAYGPVILSESLPALKMVDDLLDLPVRFQISAIASLRAAQTAPSAS